MAKALAVCHERQTCSAKEATVNSFFVVCFLTADGKGPLPSVADGKGVCRPPSMPLLSTMADGKVVDSCSVCGADRQDILSIELL